VCGRFNVVADPLTRFIAEITGQGFEIVDQYNIAPTEQIPVLVRSEAGRWDLREMRWWLVPYWAEEPTQKYSMYNAKSETLTRSRAFREPFRHRRCIVPASGYYEWKKEGSARIPFYITPRNADGFAFAGLWDKWKKDERSIVSCAIVTTAAPEGLKDIHDRIPVHLSNEQVEAWVDGETKRAELEALLAPATRMPLAVTPVSSIVNNARNKDERCVEPIGKTRVVR
jgi:putative SOS response-associated peptidase YedK